MQSRALVLIALLTTYLGSLLLSPAMAQRAVTTQNGDNARTGANLTETALTPDTVKAGLFGKLFTITGLDANVNGQALYVPQLAVAGAAHNVLYAYQSNNTDNSPCGLSAFDADTGALLWHVALPQSATYTTATPVIDIGAGTIYVLSKTGTDNTGATYLHAIGLATGRELAGSPVQVQATARGTGDGTVGGVVSFDGPASSGRFHANDRAALLLLNGIVYAAFAHNSDSFPYHGWVLGYQYDGARFTQKSVFCTTPSGGDGGIWQAGKGLTADADGNIYLSIGNGTFDANSKGITSGTDYGMCYLKLSPDLQVLDWFAPFDQKTQSDQDLDLGNTGLVGIPGTTRLFAGATKFGAGFLLDSHGLGGFTPNGPDKVVLRLNGLSSSDNVGQNPVAWDAGAVKYVYLWPSGSQLKQFAYSPAAGSFSPGGVAKQTASQTAGGSLAVSADGSAHGIVWAVGYDSVLHAFDAADVSRPELWNSSTNAARDALGSVGHFQFPTVTNGKVYVPTGAASIAVYGLLRPVWTANSVSVGQDGAAHLLWNKSDGASTLWTLGANGLPANNSPVFGPYAGWAAQTSGMGAPSATDLLWNNADGRTTVWNANADGSLAASPPVFGPFAGWTALAAAAGRDGGSRLLWSNADGRATLWTLSAQGSLASSPPVYGPFPGWAAVGESVGADTLTRLLWANADGRATLWTLGAEGQPGNGSPIFGPYAGWTAKAIATGADGLTRVLWTNADGRATLWVIHADGSFADTPPIFGPYAGWTAVSLAVGPDGNARLLWDNTDGRATLWTVSPSGNASGFQVYGPY